MRKLGSTYLRIETNFDTTEEVTLKHPGTDDPAALFLINTEPFKPSDWAKIERAKRKLRPGMRANVWVWSANLRSNPSWTGAPTKPRQPAQQIDAPHPLQKSRRTPTRTERGRSVRVGTRKVSAKARRCSAVASGRSALKLMNSAPKV